MDYSRLITDLLLKNQKVCVPSLGTFTIVYKSAEVFSRLKKIYPPSYELLFTETTDSTDTIFISELANFSEIPFDQAKENVKAFVDSIHATLQDGKPYVINEVGELVKKDNKIILNAVKSGILFADLYGLDVVAMPIMDIEEYVEGPKIVENTNIPPIPPVIREKSRKPVLLTVIIIAAIIALGCVYLLVFDNPDFVPNLFHKKPQIAVAKKTNHPVDSLVNDINTRANKRNALLYKENSDSSQSELTEPASINARKYYLIAGSFRSMTNAEKLKAMLEQNGYQPEVINMGDTMYRVSIKVFDNRGDAIVELNKLNTEGVLNNQVWLLSL
jgi:nucleoid DNA-binding protein